MALRDFSRSMRRGNYIPHDQFSHASHMISADEINDTYLFDKTEFKKIISKRVLLCNIEDSTTLRLYQNDVILLTTLFDMALREKQLQDLFLTLYMGWVGELSLTRVLKGKERSQQASVGGWKEGTEFAGYGTFQPEEGEEDAGLIKKIFNRGEKK